MDYLSYEQSVASGKPIELFDIAMGLTHWRLTTHGADYDFLGDTYESAPTTRTQIEQTGEIPKDGIDLFTPRGFSLDTVCIAGAPDQEITLTIYRGHDGLFVTYFRGFLTSVTFDKNAVAKYHFEPRSSDMPFIGGRRRCSRLCCHRLGGPRCGVNLEAYKISGTIDTIDGVTIEATEFDIASDFSCGGRIQIGNAQRMITAHSGEEITISRPFGSDIEAGASFYAWPGCDHTPTTCKNVYNNKVNYGGQEFLPVKNPYAGDLIY